MHHSLKLTLPATLELAQMVRETSKAIFKWMGFNAREISQWELIVDELFMNAVEYGSDPENAQIDLNYQKTLEGALFQIEDEGSGPKKISAEALRTLIHEHQKTAQLTDTSGRGLGLIMEKWTDAHAIETSSKGGILIRVEKKHREEVLEPKPLSPLPVSKTPNRVIRVSENVSQINIAPHIEPIQSAVDALSAGQVLELNFERVKYINSIFIGHLANWYNEAHKKQAFLVLNNLKKPIQDTLTLVGLNKIFNFQR